MEGREGVARVRSRWLRYAAEVVSDADHMSTCRVRGGSPPEAGYFTDVRWPGYLGPLYGPGGVLWIANIHRNFDSAGLSSEFASSAAAAIRGWRDGKSDDETLLREVRVVYELGLRTWTVGYWGRRTLTALGVPIEAVAYANVAKCQAVDTGVTLQRWCLRRWPLQRLIDDLEPGIVLLTSQTALASTTGEWPCPVVAFSQRNGRLMTASPWRPTSGGPSHSDWVRVLQAELRRNT